MKGFLIFMVLLVGGSIYLLTHTQDLGKQAIAAVEKEEGPLDQSFKDQFYRDPAAFAVKYRPQLERRATIAQWLAVASETELMIDLARQTFLRYGESPLNTDPAYGELLFRCAGALEDQLNLVQAIEANDLYKRYLEFFPAGPHRADASAAITRLAYKYNFR